MILEFPQDWASFENKEGPNTGGYTVGTQLVLRQILILQVKTICDKRLYSDSQFTHDYGTIQDNQPLTTTIILDKQPI